MIELKTDQNTLQPITEYAERITQGQVRGRVVIDVNA
jgi:hypothetical protein